MQKALRLATRRQQYHQGVVVDRTVVQEDPPLPGKMTPLHSDHFNHQGA